MILRQFVAFFADGRWFILAAMSAPIPQENALPALGCDLIERLFRDHLDDVVSFLAPRVRCPAAAEDLAQEGYVRLLRMPSPRCASCARSSSTPLADLPRRSRYVLLLRKVDSMSYGDIAVRLGIAEKTVQRYLVKAMLHCERRLRNPPLRRKPSSTRDLTTPCEEQTPACRNTLEAILACRGLSFIPMRQENDTHEDPILAEACTWFVRLQSAQCPQAERAEFDRWLASGEAQRVAYARAETLWASLDELRGSAIPGLAEARAARGRAKTRIRRLVALDIRRQ